jgi:predicted nucleic-acid-binding protein
VIAHEGRKRGGADFVSFDKQAVRLLRRHGHHARLRG